MCGTDDVVTTNNNSGVDSNMNDEGYLAAGYNKDKNGIYRNAKGHLAPGQVINPKGGGAVSAEKKHFRRLMKDASFELYQVLLKVATDEDTPPASKIAAIKEIMDRGWGKSQTVFGDGEDSTYQPQPIIISDLQNIIDQDEDIVNQGEKLDYDDEE